MRTGNIFSRITLKTMLQSRTRTVVTIIGVILSTAMITAVTTFSYSFWGMLVAHSRESAGDWHVAVQHVRVGEESALTKKKGVEASGIVYDVGYAAWPGLTDGDGFYDYFCIESLSKEALEMLPFTLASGRLPETADEILVPSRLQDPGTGKVSRLPEDVLELDVGDLYVNGERYLHGIVQAEEDREPVYELRDMDARRYRVVGSYETSAYNLHIAGLAYDLFTGPGHGDNGYADIFLRLSDPKKTYDYAENHLSGYELEYNYDLLRWLGASRHDNFLPVFMNLAALIVSVIMVGAVSLIYNAFSISLRERTTQFGLLSSLGATKRQLRRCMLMEAFYVSAVGIPLGILSGVAGIGVTLRFVSGGIIGEMYGVYSDAQQQIALRTSLPVLALTAGLALVTVLISAWIPTRRIRRISPIETILANRDIQIRPERLRGGKGMAGLFGVPGLLADKNYKRDRRKYRSTVFSLTMSIVLFISAMSVSRFLRTAGAFVVDAPDAEILYTPYSELDPTAQAKILQILKGPEEVEQIVAYRSAGRYLSLRREEMTEAASYYTAGRTGEEEQIYSRVIILEDADFERFLRGQGLDPQKYGEGDRLRAAAFDMGRIYDMEKDRYEQMQTLKTLPLSCSLGILDSVEKDGEWDTFFLEQMPVEILDRVNAYPQGISNFFESIVCLFVPQSEAEAFGLIDENYDVFEQHFSVSCESPAEVYRRLSGELEKQGCLDMGELWDMTEEYEQSIQFLLAVDILMFGFVTLISLVSAANVFNTISTNLLLRRREFAMLRSMGMGRRAMRRMLSIESLLYTARSVLLGLVLSAGVNALIYRAGARGLDMRFAFPWLSAGIAVLGVFLVIRLTMWFTLRTIRRANISEEWKTG